MHALLAQLAEGRLTKMKHGGLFCKILTSHLLPAVLVSLLTGCGGAEPVLPQRYAESDALMTQLSDNIDRASNLEIVADIDHSRLADEAGSPMPPARVMIFSDAQLESELIGLNPLVALDLPLRVLAYETDGGRSNQVIFNSFDYLVSRYQLNADQTSAARAHYESDIALVTKGISSEAIAAFASDEMQPDGIITIQSPYGFQETVDRVNAAIDAQNDTVQFGTVDFEANAEKLGIDLAPSLLILFGGPGPGGKAMAQAPTLGLDGFCQKFLIWQDSNGRTNLSFNDLLALADRQGAHKALALRVIDFRLTKTFSDALSPD